jgi:hypothetical protein
MGKLDFTPIVGSFRRVSKEFSKLSHTGQSYFVMEGDGFRVGSPHLKILGCFV